MTEKWIDDPPESWEEAPQEPPAGSARKVEEPLQVEETTNGLVIREPESTGRYVYVSDGEVDVEEQS